MTTLVVKNLPEQLHEQLRAQAARNHRSVTKEVVTLIEAGVAAQLAEADLPPAPKRQGGRELTVEDLDAAITDERYAHYRSLGELNRYMDDLRVDRDEAR